MWRGAQQRFSTATATSTARAKVVVIGRTGGPKNKVLRAIVTRMRRVLQLQNLCADLVQNVFRDDQSAGHN